MKHMSFFYTQEQVRKQTKTVTRRLGWWFVERGELIQPVVKVQGLKKGERHTFIGPPIQVVSAEFVNLEFPTPQDLILEGFPGMDPEEFVRMFIRINKCERDVVVNRIQFQYLDE